MAEKVLLVDDEKEFVEGLAERMELRGMKVTACTNPQEALDKVDAESFDAIVLDLRCPESTALKLSSISRNPDLKCRLSCSAGTQPLKKVLKP